MNTQERTNYANREKWRALNLQINNQLRGAGLTDHKGRIVKPFSAMPDGEWKSWILELMKMRDALAG